MDYEASYKKAAEKTSDLWRTVSSNSEMLANQEEEDFENKRFKSSAFGGDEEAESLIKSYSEQVELTKEEMEVIRQNVPDRPDFDVISREEYENKSFLGKYKYNKKVKKYFKKRKEHIKDAGKNKPLKEMSQKARKAYALGKVKANIELRKDLKEKTESYRKQGLFPDVEEDADAMDEAYEREKTDPAFMDAEMDIAYREAMLIQREKPRGHQVLFDYTAETYHCKAYNDYLRFGYGSHKVANVEKGTRDGIEAIGTNKLSRDLVVRRGVKGVRTVAHMLGLKNADDLTQEQIKEELKDRLTDDQDTILTDKGFISTSLPFSKEFYPAEGDGKDSVGVEFIILAKKGTQAVNMIPISKWKKETEVLLKPGTRFKLVDVKFGDGEVTNGSEGSWKVYLTTVTENEEGILREEA